MSSFSLTPEQIAMLQQRRALSPQVAGQMQQRATTPALAPPPAQVAALDARLGRPQGQGFSQFFRPQAAAPVAPAGSAAPRRKRDPRIDAFAGIAAAFETPDYIASAGPETITTMAFPRRVVERAGLRGFLDLNKLSDDEFVMALRLAHESAGSLGDENKKDLFAKFGSVVSKRPELRKKLVAMMDQEQTQGRRRE